MRYFTKGWHVIYVKSQQERKVNASLRELNIESFLPLIKKEKQWSDRKRIIETPLFPSYVFVNIYSSLDFFRALSVNGACAYIRFGNEYAQVREKEIQKMKVLVEDNELTDYEITYQLPQIGELKKFVCGPLIGLECEILQVDNLNKISVRIESLLQNVTATVPAYYFEDVCKK